MSVFTTLRQWLLTFERLHRRQPKVVLVTAKEAKEAKELAMGPSYSFPIVCQRPAEFGGKAFRETPYAVEIRDRQVIHVPFCEIAESSEVSCSIDAYRNPVLDNLWLTLSAHILKDDTDLILTVECDAWAWLKERRAVRWLCRMFGLAHWTRLRRVDVPVDGRVLYPFLNVQLPFNRQVVKFRLRP